MLSFLFFIVIAAFVIFIIILSVIWRFVMGIFGLKRQKNPFQNTTTNENKTAHKAKIFDSSEGEYVEYEEIKDN